MKFKAVAQLEEENKHLVFLNSIKKYDEDSQTGGEQKNESQVESQRVEVHNTTLQELGFGPEEEDEMQSIKIYFIIKLR